MNDYIERIKNEAENIFKNSFPQKALELDSIINVSRMVFFLLLAINRI
jgi:hypothetical protein